MVDFNLGYGSATINDDVECLIQQINILFDTNPGDLLGDIDYGTDYEYFLYELKLPPDILADRMMEDICSLDLMGYTPEVKVYLMQGTERDIAVIQVDLYKDSKRYTKTYKIQ